MVDSITPSVPVADVVQWDEDRVYSAVCNPVRRKLLSALAREGPLPVSRLKTIVRKSLDGTRKHLLELRSAGLVIMTPDQRDARRSLYALAPSVPLMDTPTGKIMDFGFCVLPL